MMRPASGRYQDRRLSRPQIQGTVDSIQSGSGTAFSLLPAENATGNFVKIVQRVPVKIVFDHPPDILLGPGMSVVADCPDAMSDQRVYTGPQSRSAAGDRSPWLIAIVISIATFMVVLDTAIANVSLRYIAGSSQSASTRAPGSSRPISSPTRSCCRSAAGCRT